MISVWKQLEKDLSKWLSSFSSEKLQFRKSTQSITGLRSDSFKSDGMLTDGKTLIAVEVEAGQTHPDTNSGKYWFLHDKSPYKKIILFHIFTPDFNSYPWRKELARFYVEKMKLSGVPISYIVLDRFGKDYGMTLADIKERIEKILKSNFELKQ